MAHSSGSWQGFVWHREDPRDGVSALNGSVAGAARVKWTQVVSSLLQCQRGGYDLWFSLKRTREHIFFEVISKCLISNLHLLSIHFVQEGPSVEGVIAVFFSFSRFDDPPIAPLVLKYAD